MMPHSSEDKSEDKIAAVRWGIKWKLISLMSIFMMILVAILTYIQISSQKKLLEKELDKRIAIMKENLIERGESFIANLALQAEEHIAAFNFTAAMEAVKDRAATNKEIKYAVLKNAVGSILIHTGQSELSAENLSETEREALLASKVTKAELMEEGGTVIEIIRPIQISTEPWGVLRLTFTLRHLDREIEISGNQIIKEINMMIFKSVSTSLGFMALCFMIVFFLSAKVTKPLIHLAYLAKKLSKGDFSVSLYLPELRQNPSGDEVGILAETFAEMSLALEESYKKLEEYNKTLEQKVAERTEALNMSLAEVESANKKITDSIRYAKMIQKSLLPDPDNIRTFLSESFFIWMPRDIVGGDFIFTDSFEDGFILSVIDCTGHGVPGAFITLIACFGLKKILWDEGIRDPALILKRLNFIVKTTLRQDTDYAFSDDGLDAAICFIRPGAGTLTFAGAKLSLFYVYENELTVIKGDRKSLGYKKSDLAFNFNNYKLSLKEGMSFYLTTDGFADQLGGTHRRRFGIRSFQELLTEHSSLPLEKQRGTLLEAFYGHKGENDRQDDVTVVGFRL
jgi:serine phosphatase RsbU (regulator of sigma subunit)